MNRIYILIFIAAAILTFPIHGLEAQTPAIVPDRVEEDWQLVVAMPDRIGVGPQITTSMSPVSDNSTPFAAFDLNYREYPSFQAGGMQIQVWDGDKVLDTGSYGTAQFATPGETVTWTQRMSIGDYGIVTYSIRNGHSTTWSSFGGNGSLLVSFSTPYDSLSGYRPDTSVSNSGVSWESNYVTSMALVQVRYYSSGQLIATDTTRRSIIPAQ
jgi:hypothetical protein